MIGTHRIIVQNKRIRYDFVLSDDFATAIQETDNYYVIVTRTGIPSLPYSVEEIYGIRDSGKYGTLKRTYNEFYHLYQIADYTQAVRPEKVIIEDSNSGFQFFQEICKRSGQIVCVSAQGKSNIFALVAKQPDEMILVIADGAALQLNSVYLQEKVSEKILDVMREIELS